MNAGKLRHKVCLQSCSTSKDSYGEDIKTWTSFATAWAAIEPLTGRELFMAQQVSAETTIRITIRHNSTVAEAHRVVFGTRTFEIDAVLNPAEKNKYLELMCKEIV